MKPIQKGFSQIVRPNQKSSAVLGRFFDTASRKITISQDTSYVLPDELKPKNQEEYEGEYLYDQDAGLWYYFDYKTGELFEHGNEDPEEEEEEGFYSFNEEDFFEVEPEENQQKSNSKRKKNENIKTKQGILAYVRTKREHVKRQAEKIKRAREKNRNKNKKSGNKPENKPEDKPEENKGLDKELAKEEEKSGLRTLLTDPKAAEIIAEQQINNSDESKITREMNENSEIAKKKENEVVKQAEEVINDNPPQIATEEKEEDDDDETEEEEFPQEEEEADKEEEKKERKRLAKEEEKIKFPEEISIKGIEKGKRNYNALLEAEYKDNEAMSGGFGTDYNFSLEDLDTKYAHSKFFENARKNISSQYLRFFDVIPVPKRPQDHGDSHQYHQDLHDYTKALEKQIKAMHSRRNLIKNTVYDIDSGDKQMKGYDMNFLLRLHKFYHRKEETTKKILEEEIVEKQEVAEEIKEEKIEKERKKEKRSINTETNMKMNQSQNPRKNPRENPRESQFKRKDYVLPMEDMQDSHDQDDVEKIYDFNKPLSIIVIGKKGKGKTNLVRHLILRNTVHNHYFHFGMVFTGTKYDNEYDYLPDDKVVEGWNEQVFQKY
ncbi:hypothetical protein RFI_37338, partial [Reticulomyxa filosa]